MLEEETKEILRMGQWSSGVWDNSYSSKLPLGPIRKLAGFVGSKMHFNARTVINLPEGLLKSTPIGCWCYKALDEVTAACAETGKNETACEFLRFMCELNKMFLQDAAAMSVLYPDRATHPIYQLPPFHRDEWPTHLEEMRAALSGEDNPLDASLEKVTPALHASMAHSQQCISCIC